jgi:predicted aldo/keto reductase-like oxidoreductase
MRRPHSGEKAAGHPLDAALPAGRGGNGKKPAPPLPGQGSRYFRTASIRKPASGSNGSTHAGFKTGEKDRRHDHPNFRKNRPPDNPRRTGRRRDPAHPRARPQARSVIREAIRQGLGYFDSARAYAGSENYLGSVWEEEPAARQKIFQTSKSASRDRAGARRDLEQTLANLRTDYLDLWQIHDVRTEDDLKQIESPGGALEAFLEARERGLIRHIGVTGHHDPAILTRAVTHWPVDAVLLPVNPVEGILGGFLDATLPAAREKGLAVIGMKILGAGYYLQPALQVSAEELIRYALAQPITVAIVGCSSPAEVETLAAVGRDAEPFSREEQEKILGRFQPYVRRLAYYRGAF